MVTAQRDGARVSATERSAARWIALWQRHGGRWQLSLHDAAALLTVPWAGEGAKALEALAASSVSRSGVQSERVAFKVLRQD
jgi:hypothetical protein